VSAAAGKSRLRKTARFVVGCFTRNLYAKSAALVLAVVVWVFVRQDITDDYTPERPTEVKVAGLEELGLMLIEHEHRRVKVQFEGPISRIDAIRQDEGTTIRLVIRPADLQDRDRATLTFSPEFGNIAHAYGDSVKIRLVDRPSIRLTVARKTRKPVRVELPEIEGDLGEWTLDDLQLETPEIMVTGPLDELEKRDSLKPEPIDVEEILGPVGEEKLRYPVQSRRLGLDPTYSAMHIRMEPGEQILYSAVFTRSRAPESMWVPFRIHAVNGDWPVRIVPHPSEILTENEDGTWRVLLTFKGNPSDLKDLRAAAEAGEVQAYVWAMEFVPYRDRTEGRDAVDLVRLQLPPSLWGKIRFDQPSDPRIEVSTEKR